MDNYNTFGSGVNDDLFGFIPPNMMFPEEHNRDSFTSKEERERHYYHMDHDNQWTVHDIPPADKTM